MVTKSKEELIAEMFERGVLMTPEMLDKGIDSSLMLQIESEQDIIVLNSDYAKIVAKQTSLVDWHEIDRYKVEAEKERNDDLYQHQLQQVQKVALTSDTLSADHSFLVGTNIDIDNTNNTNCNSLTNTFSPSNTNLSQDILQKPKPQIESSLEVELTIKQGNINLSATYSTLPETSSLKNISEVSNLLATPSENISINIKYPVNIVISYENIPHKYEVKDFTNIFISRYKFIEKLLRSRQEILETLTTVGRVLGKKERETVSIIGMVKEINITKNNNILITMEDLTGSITILASKNKADIFSAAKDLVHDEIVGISGMSGDKIIFADKIIWPDIPTAGEPKIGPEDISAIFLSDIHLGSKMFLKDEFNKFLAWIRGEAGSDEQKESAKKVKYIFIAGDLVDGIGIYPSQEEELEIKEIGQQYAEFVKLISQIPADKQIIVCPGNHDLVHLAEPQPAFYKQYAPGLFNLPNLILVTNPAIINIGKTKEFSGFDVLMYHGYSFDYYIANVESIRNAGGYHRADLIMKFLLKRRHLAPSFKSTPYFPAHAEDPLLIKKIPDFFLSGHIHYSKVGLYKGVTLISGSCWQSKTSFQEKLGHEPEPARVPLINLKTREVKVLKFI